MALRGLAVIMYFPNRGAIGSAVSFDPTQRILDPGNEFGGYFTWGQFQWRLNWLGNFQSYCYKLMLRQDESTVNRYITNVSADYPSPLQSNTRLARKPQSRL